MKGHRRQNIVFSIKVWLTTAFLPALLIQSTNFINHRHQFSHFRLYLFDYCLPYIIGLVVSTPYLIVFTLVVLSTDKQTKNLWTRKIEILAFNFFCMLFIFVLVWGDAFHSDLKLISIYLFISATAILTYKLDGQNTATNSG